MTPLQGYFTNKSHYFKWLTRNYRFYPPSLLTLRSGLSASYTAALCRLLVWIWVPSTWMKSEHRMIMSCPNVVRPSSMELSRFFSRSMGNWQTLSGYISHTNVIILKYCKHRDGNLRRSTVMRGMIVFSPYRHTSAAVTVCSPLEESSVTAKGNTKQNMVTIIIAFANQLSTYFKVRIQVLKMTSMMMSVFWYVAPCGLVNTN